MDEVFESNLSSIAFGIYTLKGRERIVRNIKEFMKEKRRRDPGIETWIDITILSSNIDEIPKIVALAGELGIDGVILHKLFTLHNPSLKQPSTSDIEEVCREAKNVGKGYGVKVYCPPKKTRPCRVALLTIFISWDYVVSPCCFLHEMGVTYGSILDNDLKYVLEKHREFLRGMESNEICRKCPW